MQYNYYAKTLLDAYYLFNSDRNKYNEKIIDTDVGEIMFYNDKNISADEVYIFHVEIYENQKRKGIFSSFIKELYNNKNIKRIGLLAVGSTAMIKCINRLMEEGMNFIDDGGNFIVDI